MGGSFFAWRCSANPLAPNSRRCDTSQRGNSVGLSNRPFPLGKGHRGGPSMATALDDFPAVTRVRDNGSDDARLFSLLDELRKCEKCRDDLLDHLWSEHSDQVEAAAGKACDAARAIYERVAAIKPTTRAGVLRQLELAARGWVAPWTVPIALAALREIADRPPPFKMGRLPPVPAETGVASKSAMRDTEPMPHGPIVRAAISPLTPQHGARPVPE